MWNLLSAINQTSDGPGDETYCVVFHEREVYLRTWVTIWAASYVRTILKTTLPH